MTTHLSTSLPNALRGAACVVGTWMPVTALPLSLRRRPSSRHARAGVAPH